MRNRTCLEGRDRNSVKDNNNNIKNKQTQKKDKTGEVTQFFTLCKTLVFDISSSPQDGSVSARSICLKGVKTAGGGLSASHRVARTHPGDWWGRRWRGAARDEAGLTCHQHKLGTVSLFSGLFCIQQFSPLSRKYCPSGRRWRVSCLVLSCD